MKEVETTVIRTDGVPVRVEDNSAKFTLGFLILAAIALIVGGVTMYNNSTTTALRQQTIDMQQTSLQQQQNETQRLQDMTALQQSINMQQNAAKPATTNVVITDGLNGGAGPGSEPVAPPVQEVKVAAPGPAAAPAESAPLFPAESSR
ncbi:hypothetical protein BH11CYA1_BH11CYA1_18150 [soil metagenome]